MIRILMLAILITVFISCNKNNPQKEILEDIEIQDSIPSIDSYITLGGEMSLITDVFNFKYRDIDYSLVVARTDCKSGCGQIHLVVYEIKDGSYIMTDKLFPKDEFEYPNGSVDLGVFTLFRDTPNLDELTAFTEKIEFNSKTRIVTYDEFIEDKEDGYIYPTGKKISWELKEY